MSVPRSSFLSPNLFFASIIQHNSIYMHVFFIDFFQSDFYNKLVKITQSLWKVRNQHHERTFV